MPNFGIGAQVKVPEINPLTTVGQAATALQALNQNKLFQQEFGARSAIGPIYQQSIDPKTGKLDTNKLLSLASQNPNVAFKAGELAAEALGREQTQLGISGAELEQATKRRQAFMDATSSLLADPQVGQADATPRVLSATSDLIGQGILTPEQGIQALVSFPKDPAQQREWLTRIFLNSLPAGERGAAMFGQPQMVETGAAIVPTAVSPLTGTRPIGAPIAKTLTPGEQAAPRQAFVNGQPGTVPTGAVVDEYGRPRAGGVGGPGGFLPTGPRLGQEAAASTTGTKSAEQGIALQQTADQVPTRRAALLSMREQLDNFESGPMADQMARLGALAAEFGYASPKMTASTKATEEFNKLSTQIVLGQVAALGGAGTDDKLAAGIKGNPNSALSKMGNRSVIALMLGNEDAIAAKNEAWQRWLAAGHGPESYGSFSTQFNRLWDPRVFQSQYMSPEERAGLVNGMTKSERGKFERALRNAQVAGWIDGE